METLRIAHVLPSFGVGGQERVALDLARTQLAEGHDLKPLGIVAGRGLPLAPGRKHGRDRMKTRVTLRI